MQLLEWTIDLLQRSHRRHAFAALLAGCLLACGAQDDVSVASKGAPPLEQVAVEPGGPACSKTFESSFAAVQELIFERHGCTAGSCHGEAKLGGLDLRAEVSYENLVDVPSMISDKARIQPGSPTESFLYQKLRAATHPGSVKVAGSPMPVGAAPLTESELEAVQLWITKGAPKTGSVRDATKDIDLGKLLGACLPPAKPVKIKPLDAPAPSEGVQFRMPVYALRANSEVEQCTPFVYDFSSQVPPEFKDEQRNVMFVNSHRVRQDPQSHHLVIFNPRRDPKSVTADASWTCRGGVRAGTPCNPSLASADCGEHSVCAGKTVKGTFCDAEEGGLTAEDIARLTDPAKRAEALADPRIAKAVMERLAGAGMPSQLVNAQAPQEYVAPLDGVYWEIPLRGVLWFNSHAFNLEDVDTELDARVNFFFAGKRVREMRQLAVTDQLGAAGGQAPFTRKTYCAKHVVPQNWSLAVITGHTHRRGERFWIRDPSGKQIYENFSYNDPLYQRFEPYLVFDSPDAAARTLEYCATYNNGLKKDDSPDLNLVTRASRMPPTTSCTPVACVAGKVTAACQADRDCDSSPGRGDGDCDACAIKAGMTTEDEMFAINPWYVLPPKAP